MAANPPAAPLATHSTVGRYRIEKLLGNGAFGITYLARDVTLERSVAIKEFFPSGLARRADSGTAVVEQPHVAPEKFAREREHFLREAKIVARVSHPGIVRIIDFIEANNTTYIVMDFIDGRSLADQIATTGLYTPQHTRLLLSQLLPAVEALHGQGVIHGDIKPDNILIQKNGAPILIDFGSAIAQDGSFYNRLTPGYAAPEQYPGQGEKTGPWTDIYALGAVLFACLTGKTPPAAPDRVKRAWSPVPGRDTIWGGLEKIIESAMTLHATERPQSISQLSALAAGKANRSNLTLSRVLPLILLSGAIVSFLAVLYLFFPGPPSSPPHTPSLSAPNAAIAIAKPKTPPPPANADLKFDDSDYAAAQKINTPDAYALYLINHPRGKYVEKAKMYQQRQP